MQRGAVIVVVEERAVVNGARERILSKLASRRVPRVCSRKSWKFSRRWTVIPGVEEEEGREEEEEEGEEGGTNGSEGWWNS